jgi:hypothetical protein
MDNFVNSNNNIFMYQTSSIQHLTEPQNLMGGMRVLSHGLKAPQKISKTSFTRLSKTDTVDFNPYDIKQRKVDNKINEQDIAYRNFDYLSCNPQSIVNPNVTRAGVDSRLATKAQLLCKNEGKPGYTKTGQECGLYEKHIQS